MNLAAYSKAIIAVLGAVSVALSDSVLDLNDGITIALALLAALGVYQVPNASAAKEQISAPVE